MSDDLSQLSMIELFRLEADNQAQVLTAALLDLERGGAGTRAFETLMRAAHSIKGAARIVNLKTAERLAHAMEDCFVAAQAGKLEIQRPQIDHLLRTVDVLSQLARNADPASGNWEQEHTAEIKASLASLVAITGGHAPGSAVHSLVRPEVTAAARAAAAKEAFRAPATPSVAPAKVEPGSALAQRVQVSERVVRLAAENLNRLLGLAGEFLVESRWLGPFADSLQRLKRSQMQVAEKVDLLRQSIEEENLSAQTRSHFNELYRHLAEAHQSLGERLEELDLYDRRFSHLSQRLYLEVLRTRMRPFGDGVRRFPRMVRDLAQPLGKRVRLEIVGENTQVDRDILERLETPLAHLLRNAIDHGCELPEERRQAGKPEECTLRLEARHSAGVLLVSVADDGAGVDVEKVRSMAVRRKLLRPPAAILLSEAQALEFLFLPGFSLKETVTEISGRGFGLDVVQNMVKSVRGTVRVTNQAGQGFRVQLQLPLTLSVLRALLVDVGGEPYAFPLSQIVRTLTLPRSQVQILEGRHHFHYLGQQIGILTAHEVLECGEPRISGAELPAVLLGERNALYGLIVDRLLGERELVVQPLDPRLGKVRNVSSAALMEDGSPVLILEVDEVVKSIEALVASGTPDGLSRGTLGPAKRSAKRVLIVDDSFSVRELISKLLAAQGFEVEQAADGLEAWLALQAKQFALVVTDVNMPRMDGIQLTARIKNDSHLRAIPVLMVSYKDSEEDRVRGLEAGADDYLTKGAFQGETLVKAVNELTGGPEESGPVRR